jgi:hypothetical protein
MKKIIKYSLVLMSMLFVVSCDKDFDDLNRNQTSATSLDPIFQLNNAILSASYPGGSLVYEVGIVQQIISPNSGVLTGANYNQDNRISTDDIWVAYYRNVIKNTKDVIVRTKDDPTRGNAYQMARIIQAFAFMVLTDTYGDVPYSQGGAGYSEQVFFPEYDTQQSIYEDLIKEFTEATAALSTTVRVETGDILYNGNVAQWKKFGYSLLLRAGMRLSKVDPGKAQTVVAAAFAGGVITTNGDNAYVRHDNNYQQAIGGTLNATEAANFYLTAPFVNYLKNTSDPRLSAIAVRYKGAKSGPEQTTAIQTTAAADQIGMPMGYDNATIVPIAAGLGLASFYDFSQVDRRRLAKVSSPVYFVTASQNHLLLAEAAQRGWITGDAATLYNLGVTLAMAQMAQYDPASAVSASDANNYLTANPFNPATALEQINTQYWISSFLNGPETWANFRRSGFPTLTKNPYPGSEITGNFINRLTYPNSEISVNSTNYQAAVARQGADDLNTKVWWDK